MTQQPQTIGPYRILEPLGAGGMGVVYRAEHVSSGRPVALKTVRVPQGWLLQGIRREIRALARIRHPGIVRILEEGVHAGLPWYAMELVEGVTLQAHARPRDGISGRPRPAAAVSTPTAVTREPAALPTLRTRGAATAAPEAAEAPSESPPAGTPSGVPMQQLLGLVRRLCAALAFLHGEGIVHRDLKPGNILVRRAGGPGVSPGNAGGPGVSPGNAGGPEVSPGNAGGPEVSPGNVDMPVIVDFGLVAQFGGELSREELAVAGEMVGTAAYMAPEQILGDFVDARTDLYALGCILYELLTGRPPFVAASRLEMGRAHLLREPLPPSGLVPGLPPQLDALVLRLLAKHPRDRLGHANDVAAALALLGAEAEPDSDAPPPRAYLYRPGLAGRQADLERLEQRLDGLAEGRGGIILVGGESGVGKTRLAMELARKARLRKLPVLTGEAPPTPSPEALGALRGPLQAIADRCREGGPAETTRILGHLGRVLAAYAPEMAGLPGQVETQDVAPLPAAAARLRLYAALTETFAAMGAGSGQAAESGHAARSLRAGFKPAPPISISDDAQGALQASDTPAPTILILDDLQWADELTLGWLEYLGRAGAEPPQSEPLLVLGTYRSEDAGALGRAPLQGLLGAPEVERFDLERLDEKAVGSMVGDMLAMAPPPALFVRFLTRHSEGNPFFVAEYLRAAVAEGLLYRDGRGRWQVLEPAKARQSTPSVEAEALPFQYEDLPLPRSLRDLVGRRLQGLPRNARLLVEAAAAVGREADVLLVWEVSRISDEELLDALDELLRRQVLEMSAPGRLRFLHDKIREVASAAIPAGMLGQLHGAVATALEARPAAEREEHLAELAEHWELAGAPEKAAPHALAGARRAAARFTHTEAQRLYRAYFRLAPGPSEDRIRAHCELSVDVLRITGHGREAAAELQQALDEVLALSSGASTHRPLEGLVLLQMATLCQEQGQPEQARELAERALPIVREAGQQRHENLLLGLLAIVEREQGRPEASRALYEQALAMSRARGDRLLEATQLANFAVLCYEQGSLEETRRLQEEALTLLRATGNRRFEAVTLSNLAFFHYEAGRTEQARALWGQALELHHASGDRRSESYSLSSLGLLSADEGRIEEAVEMWGRALTVQHQSGDRASEGATLLRLAALDRRKGAVDQAERVFRQAESLLRQGHYASDLCLCLCGLGHTALARREDASGFLTEAESIAATLHAGAESGLQKAVSRLRSACEDASAGRPLLHGERPEDVPERLRMRLLSERPVRPRNST